MAESEVESATTVDDTARASPWPVFVAFGLVLSELGVLFGFGSVSVGGLGLFATSLVGILRESGYAASLWRPSAWVGGAFLVAGAAVYLLADLTARGTYIGVTGALVLVVAAALFLYETGRL